MTGRVRLLPRRGAIDWVLDQYNEKMSRDSTIAAKVNTFCCSDSKEINVDLAARVVTGSLETAKISEAIIRPDLTDWQEPA